MDIYNYFNSEEFWDIVVNNVNISKYDEFGHKYNEQSYKREIEQFMRYIVEESMKFYLLFKDDKNIKILLSDYITNIIPIINTEKQNKIHENCDNLILHYLYRLEGVNDPKNLTEQEKDKCFDKIFSNLIKKSYAFHAFNNASYASIKTNGINPDYSLTNQEDINRINEIFLKYGLKSPFFMQQKNCVNQISYSLSPNVSYGYGIDSPEWFANFCHYGGIAYNPLLNRDYNFAYDNISKKISTFSENDKKTVLDFFNKNWSIYASRENIPILAIIPLNEDCNEDEERNDFKNNMNFYIEYVCLDRGACDIHTNYLDTSNALFVPMPSYNKLMKLAEIKYTEQIEDSKSNYFK